MLTPDVKRLRNPPKVNDLVEFDFTVIFSNKMSLGKLCNAIISINESKSFHQITIFQSSPTVTEVRGLTQKRIHNHDKRPRWSVLPK